MADIIYLLTALPLLVPALYGAQAVTYLLAYIAARLGLHAAWAYLASAGIHGALGTIYFFGAAGH